MTYVLAFLVGVLATLVALRVFSNLVVYRRTDELTAAALERCERESGSRGLCDACAQRLARAAYNQGAFNKAAAIREAENRVANNSRAYWMKHILRLKQGVQRADASE